MREYFKEQIGVLKIYLGLWGAGVLGLLPWVANATIVGNQARLLVILACCALVACFAGIALTQRKISKYLKRLKEEK